MYPSDLHTSMALEAQQSLRHLQEQETTSQEEEAVSSSLQSLPHDHDNYNLYSPLEESAEDPYH